MTLAIHTNTDADRIVQSVRAEVGALDPTLPVFEISTMEDMVGAKLAPQRLVATLLSGFSLVALLLAVVGIYGVMAAATAQRTREVALRIALGATRRDVVWPLVREGVMLVAAGAVLGLLIALPATGLLRDLPAGVSPHDPLTFGAAIALLTGAALVACYVPARRASKVNPVEALRIPS
jgi:putative ABC transport system permease protein